MQEARGNQTCRLLTGAFADCFLVADELIHTQLEGKPIFEVCTLLKNLKNGISSLQAHLGKKAATTLSIGLSKVEQGCSAGDIIEIREGASKIKETTLKEGLIAIAEECGRREQ
jgi:hypothetical protein